MGIHPLLRRPTRAKPESHEGAWFAVPLPDGGYGRVLVARHGASGALLGYFFGPRTEEPGQAPTEGVGPGDEVLVGAFSHLGITKGTWPRLGKLEPWSREQWPMPIFARRDEVTGRIFLVHYRDDDAGVVVREELLAAGSAADQPQDTMMGAIFAQKRLSRLLAEQ